MNTPTRPPRGLPFRGDPLSRIALVVLVGIVGTGVLGPLLGLGGSARELVGPRLSGPSAQWPLGTDNLGRSLLPRVIEGIGTTLLLSTLAVLVTCLAGVGFGLLAGYRRGAVDQVVVRATDTLFAFPPILLALVCSAVLAPGITAVLLSVVLVTLPLMIRVVRASAAAVAGRDFVLTAVVSGASTWRVLRVHLLPNVMGPVVVQATYAVSAGMLVEGAISFLGAGVQPPRASLGSLLQEGSPYITTAPWYVLGAGAVLAVTILSVNLLGDGVRDVLDPHTDTGREVAS